MSRQRAWRWSVYRVSPRLSLSGYVACLPRIRRQAIFMLIGGSMSSNNPYEAPRSEVNDLPSDNTDLEQMASGQKLIIYSIILNFLTIAVQHSGGLALALSLVALVMSIIGIVRLCGSFGYSTGTKVLLIIGCFIPLVNLVILVTLSVKATNRLREGGYRVGLLGASRQ